MTSINFNAAAVTALRSVQETTRAIAVTQARLSTGLKVAKASDNPATWAMAQGIRSDLKSSSVVRTGLEAAASVSSLATNGLDQAGAVLAELRSKLVAASDGTSNRDNLQADIADLQRQLASIVAGSSLNGVNWLDGSRSSASFVSSVTSAGVTSSTVSLSGATLIDGAAGGILDKEGTASGMAVTAFNVTGATGAEITAMLVDLDKAASSIRGASTSLGATTARIEAQGAFLTRLDDIKETALGKLVDADIETETARLAALQVRLQLSIEALAIANATTSNVLRLFQ